MVAAAGPGASWRRMRKAKCLTGSCSAPSPTVVTHLISMDNIPRMRSRQEGQLVENRCGQVFASPSLLPVASVSPRRGVVARSRNVRPEDEGPVEPLRFRVQSRIAEKHRSSLDTNLSSFQRRNLAKLALQAALSQLLIRGSQVALPKALFPLSYGKQYALRHCSVPQRRQIPSTKIGRARLRRSTADRNA
jgi:hypothetical protein